MERGGRDKLKLNNNNTPMTANNLNHCFAKPSNNSASITRQQITEISKE